MRKSRRRWSGGLSRVLERARDEDTVRLSDETESQAEKKAGVESQHAEQLALG
jgi:hypothetical protein